MTSNIKVYVRLRPICAEKNEHPIEYEMNKNELQLKKLNNVRNYYFDQVFNEKSKQIDLSETIINPLIQQVLEGYNCTVLAYGQTGTGKTYTIEGDYLDNLENNLNIIPQQAGLLPRAFFEIFNFLKPEDEFKISVIEIYNEEVFDLLSDNNDSLRIYEGQKGVILNNLKEYLIKSADDFNKILLKTNSKKQVACTLMNKRSSRSHVIYQFTYLKKETLSNNQTIEKVGKLNLVDLAGSECSKRTGCQDLRAVEAGNINRSLLTLTRVIDALVKNQKYIPFRSSNLTRIIQDTLGGNSKTILIATLSPALIDFEDTISTLTFASTVKQVKNNASANVKIIQNDYYEEKLKELEENLIFEQNKSELEKIKYEKEKEVLIKKYENEMKVKDNELKRINALENNLLLKEKELSELKNKLFDMSETNCKENLNEPLSKKRKSSKIDDLSSIKKELTSLNKNHNSFVRSLNKFKSLILNLENTLKEEKKDIKLCDNYLDQNLSSFLPYIFNVVIKDEFDLFYEYVSSNIFENLPNKLSKELEEKFTEFSDYVHEKLELVHMTVDNGILSDKEALETKNEKIEQMKRLSKELNEEMKKFLKEEKKISNQIKKLKKI